MTHDNGGNASMSIEARVFENELMRAALDTARIGLCVISSEGLIVMLGGDVAARLGTTESALIGMPYVNLRVPELVLSTGSDLFSLDAPEVATEARLTRSDGSITILIFQARTMRHANGEAYRVLTIIDLINFGITRNRFLELRRQLDSLNSSVVVSDARQTDMPIIWVNKSFETLTGYPAAFAIGKNCRFLQNTDRSQPGAEKIREAVLRRQSCQVVLTNYRKDGSAFHNELFVTPLYDKSGEVSHYVGFQRECSGRVAPVAEAALKP